MDEGTASETESRGGRRDRGLTTIGDKKAMTFRKMVSATAEAGKGTEKASDHS